MAESSTIIVVPCYNETNRLNVNAFADFVAARPNLAFLFVNDGSTDETGRVLSELAARNKPQLRTMALERNMGKAEAVRRGFMAAIDLNPQFIAFWDADLATPLSDIDVFERIITDRPTCMAVFGSRVNMLGRNVRRNLMRHYIGRVFATAAATVLRLSIYDTQCGAKMFRNNAQLRDCFETEFISRWIFDVEIIARMRACWNTETMGRIQEAIYEHPLMVWRDVHGSKLQTKDFVTVAIDLLRIAGRYGRSIAARDRAERSSS